MKVFVLAPGENWIVDRQVQEFYKDNHEICTRSVKDADAIWILADWAFDKLPYEVLSSGKPIITTCHHYVPDKFDARAEQAFRIRDSYTTAYTVPNFRTRDFISKYTDKPIHIIPYWVHTESWKKTGTKEELRAKYDIPEGSFVIGSFQRDTEGHDLKSPKLEKGPDILADFICREHRRRSIVIGDIPKVHVVLAGWRRQYIIERLDSQHVPYTYIELPSQEVINELYQTLDLYPITSRYEGGPQALIEAGMLEVPVVSRPIGMAEVVLTSKAIADDVSTAIPEVPNVEQLKTPQGYVAYIELLKSVTR